MTFPVRIPPTIARPSALLLALLLPLAWACGSADHDHGAGDHEHGADADHEHGTGDDHEHGTGDEAWAVTAFGERYEIFAEAEPLAVGVASRSHTHVTVLDDFSSLKAGRVEAILTAPGLDDQVFAATEPLRDGIFDVVIEPRHAGTFSLRFRVEASVGNETIDAGSVRVGTRDAPGGLLAAAFANATADGEPTSFLKEQQWKTAFATAWVRPGALADSVRGPATIRPPAGGEVILTAPVDGVINPSGQRPWPHPGRAVRGGERLFTIVPRNTGIGTLASLEAAVTRHAAELETRHARLERLQRLLTIEAVSQREVEEVRTEVVSLEADLDAAQQDLANEKSARRGGRAGDADTGSRAGTITIEAPFTARVATVHVSPGETVAAGDSLARLVVPAPLWVEVRLPPTEAMQFDAAPSGMLLRTANGTEIAIDGDDLELVARYPEVEATTGTVGVVFALQKPPDALIPGLRAEAELLLPTAREGIVIPRDALVDDSGIDVVYVQQDGESFARREVAILARQGERILVDGLHPGERLVVRGGPTLRRASLMASGGDDHGHVH